MKRENVSMAPALEKAKEKSRPHCAHFYPAPDVILRRTLMVMWQFDGLTCDGFGEVISIWTWKAYFEVLTHVLGTRRASALPCLSDPRELHESGHIFFKRRKADEGKGQPRIVESKARDSKIESMHRVMRSWLPATRYSEVVASYVLLLIKIVEFNRRMGVERGIVTDYGTPNELKLEQIAALYRDVFGPDGVPRWLSDMKPPPELTDLAKAVGLLTWYNPDPSLGSDLSDLPTSATMI